MVCGRAHSDLFRVITTQGQIKEGVAHITGQQESNGFGLALGTMQTSGGIGSKKTHLSA